VNDDKLDREREGALTHPVRQALRDALDGGEGRTLSELGSTELPKSPTLSTVHYHLKTLERVKLIVCVGGRYRAA
jgi:Helix-turn-helix domain